MREEGKEFNQIVKWVGWCGGKMAVPNSDEYF